MTAPSIAPSYAPPRRGAELALLVVAVATAGLAQLSVSLGLESEGARDPVVYAVSLAVLFGLAHLAMRRLAPYADPVLLPCLALLNGLGVVLIGRLDAAEAQAAERAGDPVPGADAPLQLGWTAVGLIGFVLVLWFVRDHTRLARYAYTSAVLGLVMLMLPALPVIGREINGARLWVRIGPVQVQPGEVAKLALVLFFAAYLVAKRDALALASRRVAGLDLPRARDLGPVLLAWAGSLAVLVLERDLGSSLLFFGIFIAMLYVATERTSWLLIGVGLFVAGALAAYAVFGHVKARVDTWLDPFGDAGGRGYQLVQSLFGFGTGGITGTGLGQGSPQSVPEAKTDFIMAVVGEELGLAGVTAVLVLFLVVVSRGLRAALSCREPFGTLLAAGLSFALALQVFVIVGGVTGLIPLTGVTLPWLSYGGSSVVANWALVAVLLRISDSARRPAPAAVAPEVARAALAEAETTAIRRPV